MKKLIYSIVTGFVLLSAMFIGGLSFAQEENSTTLLPGSNFNSKLVELAGSKGNIKKIIRTGNQAPEGKEVKNLNSEGLDVQAWFNEGIIYYNTEADKIYMNEQSNDMFYGFKNLEMIDLTQLDTSKVVNMHRMFHSDEKLTELNFSRFNTENVDKFEGMFYGCKGLEELDLSSFDTSSVKNMKSMFNGCSKLETLDLSSFNTEEVTDMSNMFLGCSNLMTIYASDSFSTSKVTSSSQMFNGATSLVGGNGTTYNPSKIDNTYAKIDKPGQPGYFTEKPMPEPEPDPIYESILVPGPEFNAILKDIEEEGYNAALRYNGVRAIRRADSVSGAGIEVTLTGVVDNKKVYIRYDNSSYDGIIYYYSESPTIYLNEDSSQMFKNLSSLEELELSGIDTSKVTNMASMLEGCESLEELDLSSFDTSKVESMEKMFYNCKSLKNLDLSNFDTTNVTTMQSMFEGCESLEELDLSSFDTSSVQDVQQMFYQASKLKTVYASDLFDVEDVTSYDNMFFGATQLEGGYGTKVLQMGVYDNTYARIDKPGQLGYFTEDIPSDKTILLPGSVFNITLKNLGNNRSDIYNKDFLDSTIRKFEKASELTTEYTTGIISIPLSKYPVYAWYDANNKTIYYYTEADEIYLNPDSSWMFHQLNVLENINTSEFNTSEVENMQGMFNKAYNLETLDLSNFDTTNVTTMQSMFNECKTLKELDLSSFDTSMVANMQAMFNTCEGSNCSNLETVYVSSKFSTESLTTPTERIFQGNNKLIGGNGTEFNGAYYDSTYARIDKEGQQGYFTDANNITVKFIDENGDELYTTGVSRGTTTTGLTEEILGDDRKEGHSLNYYSDEEMTENFDFEQPITKYTEIYTKWTINNYHISFVDRDGTELSGRNYEYGTPKSEIALPSDPEREGYTFDGWDREIPETMPAEDLTITATYAINKYHVSFVDREGEVVSGADYDYGTPKAEIVLPTVPAREGYTFAEWTGLPDKMPANDVTGTATYNINQYTLKFVKGNGEADEVSTKKYGETISAPSDPTREGYTFKGWDKPVPATMPASDLIITAKWEAIAPSGGNGGGYSGGGGHSHDNSDHGSAGDEEKQNNTPEQETTPTDNQKNEAETQGKDNTQNATHEWLYKNGLTKYINASDARLGDSLTRSEMAKLSSIFATKVLGETPDESKQSFCSQFADISKLNGEMRDYVIKACELGYMGYQSNGVDELVNFRPYSPVTVAEASVIVSRMMWGNQNASSGKNWYKGHLYAAYNHGLLDDIRNPYRNITRGEAFEMFYRTSQAK